MEMENKKKLKVQSTNQPNKLYLVKDENLKKFLYKNSDLKKDVEEMQELGSVHIKSESKIKAREIVEIKIESSLS